MPSRVFVLEPDEPDCSLLPFIQADGPARYQLRVPGPVLDLTPVLPEPTPVETAEPSALVPVPLPRLEPTLLNGAEALEVRDTVPTGQRGGQTGPESHQTLSRVCRRSVNTTECVEVPTSEHVAEIVGRQGCKIKALRAKTNTYIKTPSRGEAPVFVVTGRKEDVAMAKREILSAAEHFSLIRASRSKASALPLPLCGALSLPGQTTIQVRVPYPVVGLVVGSRGSTIKRIQEKTHTYITTPGREQEPVFEVSGMAEDVERARDEIRAHIALRTVGMDTDWRHDDFLYNGTDVSLNDDFRCSGTDIGLGPAGRELWRLPPRADVSSSSNYPCDITALQRNSTRYHNDSASSLGSTSSESFCSGGVELSPVAGAGCRFWFSDVQLPFGSDDSGSVDGLSVTAVPACQQQALWGGACLPATAQLPPPCEDLPVSRLQVTSPPHLPAFSLVVKS
ncbi:hypothetical protein P4O66_000185 [Electrophorus voltai]|uniref:K Homology domain-containing protein n=1 Tax=Electrophorus voltai TaxID=2609070 RepID=A0AAD9E5Z9_9TELE|nr:hypothetical protein P4O66_000185 [Electrophorus voltai]